MCRGKTGHVLNYFKKSLKKVLTIINSCDIMEEV